MLVLVQLSGMCKKVMEYEDGLGISSHFLNAMWCFYLHKSLYSSWQYM